MTLSSTPIGHSCPLCGAALHPTRYALLTVLDCPHGHVRRQVSGVATRVRHQRDSLDEFDVIEIRASSESAIDLAEVYGCSPNHISKVRRGDAWTDR